ncbi:MAG TPA: 3-phosphoshikimate 1-carboxyvinyltransferase, partial [Blastocatellia bacterium]|nr:3-phosphoshikimate 1-carboxyvinyltransferase [Blastocatellia bacterium]
DHRIAMAFSIAALIADGTTEIVDADCAGVSFPEFYELLRSLTSEGHVE